MTFEWDEQKNLANQRKHLLSFEEARFVFADPFALTRPDTREREPRWHIIGRIRGVLTIVAVFTLRGEDGGELIRIISARYATATERRRYETGSWI